MTIEQRVAKLERQNRWMKRGGGLMLAVVACVVLMGQGREPENAFLTARRITAEEIVLKSSKMAHQSLRMVIDLDGQPRVLLKDAKGTPRILLTVSAISFGNEHGIGVMSVGSDGLRIENPSRRDHKANGGRITLVNGPAGGAVATIWLNARRRDDHEDRHAA